MNKTLSLLGLARKAGKICVGFDACKEAMENKKRKPEIIVLASDVSEKTKKNIMFYGDKEKVEVVSAKFNMEETQNLFRKKVGVIGVLDKDFAKGIKSSTEITAYGKDDNI